MKQGSSRIGAQYVKEGYLLPFIGCCNSPESSLHKLNEVVSGYFF